MIINFKNLVPKPLESSDYESTDVWGKEDFFFDSKNKYLVKAPSGKGKTTLLSVMYGLRDDYRGELLIDGKNIRKHSLKEITNIRKQKISVVFQNIRLFGDLTTIENLLLKNKLTDFKTQKQIEQMAEKFGLTPFLNRKTGIMSFGQQQRVAILRALLQPFEIIFLDEPFSHLDDENIKIGCQMITEECNRQKAGLILTSLGNHYYIDYDKIKKI